MHRFPLFLSAILAGWAALPAAAAGRPWPAGLPVYDHIVVVIEENKDFQQIVGNPSAPYINQVLCREGATFTRMYGEEHHSEGNYFWLFSGDNQTVGYLDRVPAPGGSRVYPLDAPSLAGALRATGRRSFKGYAEDLPEVGSTVERAGLYARKHVPYISFKDVPGGSDPATSANLRFSDFPDPAHFQDLPTVAWVIPNLVNDMHDCPRGADGCIAAGDAWLKARLDPYYQWAKTHNSLLILTFDENDDPIGYAGITDPAKDPAALGSAAAPEESLACRVAQNRILTLFAGARIKPGAYPEGRGITHVNVLRTLEAMYGLPRLGAQQRNALRSGIADDAVITDVFAPPGAAGGPGGAPAARQADPADRF